MDPTRSGSLNFHFWSFPDLLFILKLVNGRVLVPVANSCYSIPLESAFFMLLHFQALTDFSNGIQRLCETKMLPPEVYNILWDQAIKLCYNTMLEGYTTKNLSFLLFHFRQIFLRHPHLP